MPKKRKPTILFVSREYPPHVIGGVGTLTHYLAEGLALIGHIVGVSTITLGKEKTLETKNGVCLTRLPSQGIYPTRRPYELKPGQDLKALQVQRGLMRGILHLKAVTQGPHLVVVPDLSCFPAALVASRTIDCPLVTMICQNVSTRVPYDVDSVHRPWIDVESPHDEQLRIEDRSVALATHVICLSDAIHNNLVRDYGLDQSKTSVIRPGIAPHQFSPHLTQEDTALRRTIAGDDDLIVLCAARMVPAKGIDSLLLAFSLAMASVPRLHLVVVGDGPELSHLMARAYDMGIESQVHFLGFVPHERALQVYRIADVTVVPSLDEPYGYVALEFMVLGRPMITTNAGGLAEIVREGIDGLVVRLTKGMNGRMELDADLLAAALCRLATDSSLREELGRNARHRATTEFNYVKTSKEYGEAFLRIVEKTTQLGSAIRLEQSSL